MTKKFLSVLAFVICTFAVLGSLYYLLIFFGGPSAKESLLEAWITSERFLTENGFWLFGSIAILPGLILPVAPLLTLAGIWGGQNGAWLACLYSSIAVTINLTWTYWIAAGPGRNLIERLLSRTKYKIPTPDKGNELVWAIILRLTPGVPFIFTNYALGLIRMPFLRYFIVSTPVLVFTVGGYVLTFAGIFGGDWHYVWLGVSVVVIITLLGRLLANQGKKSSS
jgi:uncharacterized membrane protein YdjX (TVP38/TMEM64 family)